MVPPLLITHSFAGSGYEEGSRMCCPREIPRELIPRHRPGTARNHRHDLLLLFTTEDVFSATQVFRHWRGVLISFPSSWTRFPCNSVPGTIATFERCRPMQVQSSSVTLKNVLVRKNKIASSTAHYDADRIPPPHKLFDLSISSVEQLHIYSRGARVGQESEGQGTKNIWEDFLSLRKLFVC